MKLILVLPQVVLFALHNQSLFVDARHAKNIVRGSYVEKQPILIPDASETRNQLARKENVLITEGRELQQDKNNGGGGGGGRNNKNNRETDSPTSTPTIAPTVGKKNHGGGGGNNKNNKDTPPPTNVPTIPPTWNPTLPPTDRPTNAPTPSPTNAPVEPPTWHPIIYATWPPTNAPTHPPTNPLTSSPTLSPENPPTIPVTSRPTAPPTTSAPTHPPTNPLTSSPTLSPENPPTISVTSSPTENLQNPLVNSPTFPPTNLPTVPPTFLPTSRPTEPTTPVATVPPTIDRTKYVDVEKFQPITFNITVNKYTQLLNKDVLRTYFIGLFEGVLGMRSNQNWYPTHVKSVHEISLDLVPVFETEAQQMQRDSRVILHAQLVINGQVYVHATGLNMPQEDDVTTTASFRDSFDHSMLLYFTFWGVGGVEQVLKKTGGLKNPVINSVSVGRKQLIGIEEDGKSLQNNYDDNIGASEFIEDGKITAAARAPQYGFWPFIIMVSASSVFYWSSIL